MIKSLFCSHHYVLLNQFEVKSEFDVVKEHGYVPTTHNSLKRKYVSDYTCSNCGKFKRSIVKTSCQ